LNGHAETARIKERVGLTTQIDVYRAEIRIRDAQNSLTLARESLRSAEDRLKITLAIPLEKKIQVDAPLEYKRVEMAEVHAIKTALKNRVKLDQAAGDIQEAKRKAGIAKNNLLPGLNLLMGYERLDSPEEIGQALGLEDERWSVTLISSTDWARKAEKASYSQSLINVRNARLDLEIKKDEIKREVRQGLEALKKTEERINIRKDQIHQAEGKLAISNVKFKYNMANNFDIIEAETELQQARVNLLSAKTDYITGTYRMRAALGTLIER
jgi:outer membrane protein TolC